MRRSIKVYCIAVAVLALAVTSAALAADAPPAAPKPVEVGDKMVDFQLTSLDGKDVSFSKDIAGKHDVVVLAFMNTNCASCLAEMDTLTDVALKYGNKMGFYAISVDMRGAETVGPYSKKNRFTATYLLDPEFSLAPKVGLTYTPSTIVLDKAGTIQLKKSGHKPGDLELIADAIVKVVKK